MNTPEISSGRITAKGWLMATGLGGLAVTRARPRIDLELRGFAGDTARVCHSPHPRRPEVTELVRSRQTLSRLATTTDWSRR